MALTSNSVSRKTIKILILITEAEAVEFTQDTRETAQDLDKRKLTCQSWRQMHLLSSLSLTTGGFGEAVLYLLSCVLCKPQRTAELLLK